MSSDPLNRYSEPGRPEFREYRMSPLERVRLLNSIAFIYNEIYKDDPSWTPMEIFSEEGLA